MTTEELKSHVRAYNDEHYPGWECSGVTTRVGQIADAKNQLLLVLPVTAPPITSSTPPL